MRDIKPITMPGTHQSFLRFFKKQSEPVTRRILDMGAGHGAFSQCLYKLGYQVEACDINPDEFEFEKIECRKVDITSPFPYNDNSFDLIIAIEVSEHITDHDVFFRESSRVLSPGGKLYITTPNILSLKSRIRFLFSGFFLSFKALEYHNQNGLQHITSRTPDQYNYLAVKNRFSLADIDIDREQKTSRFWYCILYPLLYLYPKIKKISTFHNHRNLLLGRIIFLTFHNQKV